MKKKFNYLLFLYALAILLPVIALLFWNFRSFAIKESMDKATIIAELTKDGLTTHMVNGIMDKRDEFLSQIKRLHGVKNIRVLRSPLVDKQFGKSFESYQQLSSLEKKVLQTGKPQKVVEETPEKVNLKIVIPYIASAYNSPNCLKCHQVKEGAVLGAISMDFDITNIRKDTLDNILKILLIILLVSIGAFFFLNKQLSRYVNFFENLKSVMKSAFEGDYSKRLPDFQDKELHDVAYWINALLDKIEQNLKKITTAVRSFVKHKSEDEDPLRSAALLVEELARIYQFKNIIDKDKDIDQIFNRLGELLSKKFGIQHFCIYEIHQKEKIRTLRYQKNYEPICQKADEDIELCRAYRIKEPVFSDDVVHVCGAVDKSEYLYLCFPLILSEEVTIVLNIITKDKQEFERIKSLISRISSYLNISKTSLQTKSLMEKLKTKSLVDQLTGAYNRHFLDIFVQKNLPQALRSNVVYSILMLDIDHFKMVNDTYGHDVGDKVIKELVETIKENIRESDIVVRFGGEEFLVLLYNCPKEQAVTIAQKIRQAFAKRRIQVDSEYLQKTVSIGVSEFPTDTPHFWQAIKFADTALYKAKEGGRDRVVAFESYMMNKEGDY